MTLFHGTRMDCWDSIEEHGLLVPSVLKQRTEFEEMWPALYDAVYVVDSPFRAEWYGRVVSSGALSIILAVHIDPYLPMRRDPREREGAFMIERCVAPEHVSLMCTSDELFACQIPASGTWDQAVLPIPTFST